MRCLLLVLVVGLSVPAVAEDDKKEEVFSGPQAGEKLPKLSIIPVFDNENEKSLDAIADAKGEPVVVVFFHKRERPAFGVLRAINRFVTDLNKADEDKKPAVRMTAVFLSDDHTATKKWVTGIKKHLTGDGQCAVCKGGIAGPGAWGLNRKVSLTVVVGKGGKATDNFALIQPSVAADGPKILNAIKKASGVKGRMNLAKYLGRPGRPGARPGRGVSPQLGNLLRSVINKQNTKEDVAKAKAAVEAYLKKNPKEVASIGRIANTIVNSGRLMNYGTPAAQEVLKEWAKKYPAPKNPRKKTDSP